MPTLYIVGWIYVWNNKNKRIWISIPALLLLLERKCFPYPASRQACGQ